MKMAQLILAIILTLAAPMAYAHDARHELRADHRDRGKHVQRVVEGAGQHARRCLALPYIA